MIIVAANSCGKSDATAPSQQTPTQNQPTVATVLVQTNSTAPLTTGVSVVLFATAQDATGNTVTGNTFTWKSSDTTVATVTSAGPLTATLTAIAPGSVTITATTGTTSGTAFVTVSRPIVPTTVVVRPDSVNYEENAQGLFAAPAQLGATLADANGAVLSGIITWSSSNTAAASVSSTGIVTANPSITASTFVTITATSSGTSGSATIVVNPQVGSVTVSPAAATIIVGQATTITATVRDTRGNILTGVALGWTNFNANIVRLTRFGDSVSVIGLVSGFATVVAGDLINGTTNATAGITVTGSASADRKRAVP
jgi:trimeric autotransporter adhesin